MSLHGIIERLVCPKLAKRFNAFYGKAKFINMFIKLATCHPEAD
jgi:hypothetical protein